MRGFKKSLNSHPNVQEIPKPVSKE